MYPHSPAWMMTYCLDTPYVPGARGEGWERLAWHVAGESTPVAQYMIRMLGYSLLGDNREQLVFFLKGPTGSGKSQLLEAVMAVLGPLAHSSTGALISRNKTERHARVENSIARKRFVVIDESAERIMVDEGQLKRLTGSGVVSRSKLYESEEIPTIVTWAIWQATNEMPTLTGFDAAIRRRLRAIPCGSTIESGDVIKNLGRMLAATEAEAILACLVAGCMEYLASGERCPAEVELATAEYESEQNTAAAFRGECTMDVPWTWGATGQQGSAVSYADMRKEYVAWCQATRTTGLPKQAFNSAFRVLPGIQPDDNQKRYVGIVLVSSYRQDRQDL
jgi:putative DNA primase/helicase